MESYSCCQSCGMPLDKADVLGTEIDQSKSTIYCRYCYRDGEFTNRDMSLEEMKEHVRGLMQKMQLPEDTIAKAIGNMHFLTRWQGIHAIHHCREWH